MDHLRLQPAVALLYGIGTAFLLAQIHEAANGEAFVIGLATCEQGFKIVRDPAPRFLGSLIIPHQGIRLENTLHRDVHRVLHDSSGPVFRRFDNEDRNFLFPAKLAGRWTISRNGDLHLAEAFRSSRIPNAGGTSSVTLVDTGIDERMDKLRKQKIDIRSASNSPIVRICIIADPDGNQIVFAQSDHQHRAVA